MLDRITGASPGMVDSPGPGQSFDARARLDRDIVELRSPSVAGAAAADATREHDGGLEKRGSDEGSRPNKALSPTERQTDQPDKGDPENQDQDRDDQADKGGGGVKNALRNHPYAIGVAAIILIAAVVLGTLYYLHARHYESTDDAFIDGRPVSISPEVTGNIVAVPVTDNQVVEPGDLLARIDDRDYQASVEQAAAQIEQANANVENYAAQVAAQQAQVDQAAQQVQQAEAALKFSQQENARYQELVKTGFGTVQRAQQATSDLQSKQAALDAAGAAETAAERQIKVLKAGRRSAEAQLAQAQAQKATADANLSRTQLHATMEGRVTRLTAAVGQVATQSQALMVLVPLDVWVTGNFKETQLSDMRVGQPVDIEIDAFGKSYPGHVNSVQAGSGTAFSLLPAENATGNYVKVVQRVPVKITFDKRPDIELGPGMSVVPSVTVR